jgi:hypothetical protein
MISAVPFFRKDLPLTRLNDDVLLATNVNGAIRNRRIVVSGWSDRLLAL